MMDLLKLLIGRNKSMEFDFIGLFIRLIFIYIALFFSPVSAQDLAESKVTTYPDIWSRSFEEPYYVFDIFFSDKEVWGDEPVIILKDQKTESYKAVAFFTGKTNEIYAEKLNRACRMNLFNRYFYTKDKKEMSRIYLAPQEYRTDCISKEEMSDGSKLKRSREALLQGGSIELILLPSEIRDSTRGNVKHGYVDFLENHQGVYTTVGEGESNCEPINEHLTLIDKAKNVIWSKTLVRFYPEHKSAPDYDNVRCVSKKLRVKVGGGLVLFLPDRSILTSIENVVVRLRGEDGSSSLAQSRIHLFNTDDVIKAKLEFMKAAAIREKECIAAGKDASFWGKCKLYRVNKDDLEKLQVDLFNYIFEKTKK